MNIQNIQFVLRPRRMDEIFDFALLLLRKNFSQYLRLLALPVLSTVSVNALVSLHFHQANEEAGIKSIEQLWMLLILFAERGFFSQLLVLFNGRLLFDEKPSQFGVWKELIKSLPLYIWHQILVRGIYLFILWPLLVFPFRSLIKHFFKSETILLEKLRGKRLQLRLSLFSANLYDRIFTFLLLDALFCVLYLAFVLFAWNHFLELFHLYKRFWWLDADLKHLFLSPIISAFLVPYWIFHSTAKFLLYIDLRSLKEGWDIELELIRSSLEMGLRLREETWER